MIAAAAIFYFLRKLNKSAVLRYSYEILHKHPQRAQPLPKEDQMIKIVTGSKFKMAAVAIMKSVKRP